MSETRRRSGLALALTCGLSVLLASAARAQTLLQTYQGEGQLDGRFGWAVASAGDVDGDGVPDAIVGGTQDPFNDPGEARVFSGASGALLYWFRGTVVGERFGASVAGLGDVDGDGRDDVIVASDPSFIPTALVRVYSGATGAVLHEPVGQSPVAGLGDVDGDGRGDFLLPRGGAVHVRSGASARSVYFVEQPSIVAFGTALGGIGDIDHDGRGDFIVGGRNILVSSGGDGKAFVYSGATGTLLYTFDGDKPDDSFGASVAGAGDVDMDGTPDVIVGAPFDSTHGRESGRARVFSGVDGSILFTFDGLVPSTRFGDAVGTAGDVDRDGHADLIVGASLSDVAGTDSGAVTVFSGASGAVLYEISGTSTGALFGRSVAALGDANGDGYGEFLVGAPTKSGSGRAYLYGPYPVAPSTYCTAKTNSAGCVPAIGFSGTLSVSGPDDFHVTAQQVLDQQLGIFFWSLAPASTPFQGGTRCIASPFTRTPPQNSGGTPPCNGSYGYAFTQASLAAHALGIGSKLYGQYWSRDPLAPQPIGLTNALVFTVNP